MKNFDIADKVFFALCSLLGILSFSFLYFTPLDFEQSSMLALYIVCSIALVICLTGKLRLYLKGKHKSDNLTNNQASNNQNTNT